MTYRIKNWEEEYENNRTRPMKEMAWIPVKNRHDGEGFLRIMNEKDGIVIYGCWHLILQVASRCKPRGTLIGKDGTPLNAETISMRAHWRRPQDIQRALDFCSLPQVGWIEKTCDEVREDCGQTAGKLRDARIERKKERKNGKKEDIGQNPPDSDPPPVSEKVQCVIDAWNFMARQFGLKVVKKVTDNRRKAIAARLKDRYWRENYNDAIDRIPRIPWLLGNNKRNWKADIDYFIRPDTVAKILEEEMVS